MTGEEFKEIRKKQHISQYVLSDLLSIKQPNISMWEKGKRAIPDKIAYYMLHMFDRGEV
ncbi:MAG: helix-turn-helix transcriptional regulator [Deltaproteobacteria bacterium]|nr:helix-turn-helix transcriptional regulator [Deltaproteobacteria bacterium]